MAVTSSMVARLATNQTGTNVFGTSRDERAMRAALELANGTGANQADRVYVAQRTVSSGANDDIDIAGVLADGFGTTITMAEVVGVFVINAAQDGTANTTNLTIGNATNAFEGFLSSSGTIGPIPPGGFVMIGASGAAGLGTVTAGSTDELRVANSAGAAATYQIGIIGRSA